MKSIFLKSFVILLFILTNSCVTPFHQEIKIEASSNKLIRKIDSIVITKMNQYNIPGASIGITYNDSIFYTKGYGLKHIISKDKVTENTIFHTASISKLFTAQAIMQLILENVLTLDDKLIDIIPNLKYSDINVKHITIKNLLNHTSGLSDINNYHWNNYNQSNNSLKNYILGLRLKLNFKPSSKYEYNNLGYDLLGYIIEKISNQSFEDYIKTNIFNLYDMLNSDFRYFNISNSTKISPHSKNWLNNTVYIRKTYPYTREHSPSSTLNSSSKELSKWMISFLNNLETIPELKEMIKPSFAPYPNIGLGFQLYNKYSENAIGHFGGDKGFRSFLMMIPKHKIGLVLLANCDYDEDFRQEIIVPIAELMLADYFNLSSI